MDPCCCVDSTDHWFHPHHHNVPCEGLSRLGLCCHVLHYLLAMTSNPPHLHLYSYSHLIGEGYFLQDPLLEKDRLPRELVLILLLVSMKLTKSLLFNTFLCCPRNYYFNLRNTLKPS
ncbi:hypothetical protein V8G54_032161 [Vigna mungo]|uniref:Uncharacterized protein n=1 Tax=Vigna mungo TaxID=3915 RepID=A0AAQ3RHL4_VIGMU